ncbi:hypothetical protein BHQ31_16130 [Burkholderia cenocepacia]|nr:hypothetical protein BHQ31_16130 [Burkholderia cenocepacia]
MPRGRVVPVAVAHGHARDACCAARRVSRDAACVAPHRRRKRMRTHRSGAAATLPMRCTHHHSIAIAPWRHDFGQCLCVDAMRGMHDCEADARARSRSL